MPSETKCKSSSVEHPFFEGDVKETIEVIFSITRINIRLAMFFDCLNFSAKSPEIVKLDHRQSPELGTWFS